MNMKSQIVTALRNKYESDVVSARVNLEVYLNNTVGVAEHPDVIESDCREHGRETSQENVV